MPQSVYEFADFRLDAASSMLYRNGEAVSLPPRAVETLLALVKRNGEIVPKDELMFLIWGDSVVEESNLSQYLHVLRKTLGRQDDGRQFIETLKRRGYRFNSEVTVSEFASGRSPQQNDKFVKPEKSFRSGERNAGLAEHETRVERHGNVLTLVAWQENRTEPVEEPLAVVHPVKPLQKPVLTTRLPLAAAAVLAVLLISVSLVWFNSGTTEKKTVARTDLTFLNLTNGEPLDSATISPNGNYFVYAGQEGKIAHLWLQQVGQANRIEIVPPFSGGIYGTSFTPDSKFVYYVASENETQPYSLYRVPAMGGVRTRILNDISGPVSVSPDGSEIVFPRWDRENSRSSLVVASSDGMKERVLLTRNGGEAIGTGGVWSPDGKWIAYGELNVTNEYGQCTITGIDPHTGETKVLSSEKWDTCFRMAWTSDSQGLVFIGTKFREVMSTRRDQVFYLSIGDGEARRLTTDGSRHQYASLGVTENDEILAVPFNRSSQIWAMDAGGDSRTSVQITTGQADGRPGLAPLLSGSVSYLARNGDGFSIWVMNADGSGPSQVTNESSSIEELRAAPDGRFFVFSSKLDGYSHLFRVDANGTNLVQITFGNSQEIDSDISYDGNWIAYDSKPFNGTYGNRAIWKVGTGGGGPVRLAEIDCMTPNFSPDGRSISCISENDGSILLISAEDGTTLARFGTGKNARLNVGSKWTPDGKGLAYIAFDKNVGNLWVQPINGDAKYQLTDFTSGDIHNFAFGFADPRLYLARGHSIRNAVLISNFR